MRFVQACLMLVVLMVSSAYGAPAGHVVEWSFDLECQATPLPTTATFFPNAEEPEGFVVSSAETVFFLNGDGSERWRARFEKPVGTAATVADLDGDGTPEIVVALALGDLVCLNGDGSERWVHPFEARTGDFNIIVAADVAEAEGLELLYGGEDGWLNCVSAEGAVLWRFFGDKYWVGPPGVGDVDGDGVVDIVYGTDDGHVYCLTGAGDVKWRYAEPPGIFAPYGRSGANVVDLEGDGHVEVLLTRSNVGVDSGLVALDGATGARKWLTRDVLHGYISNATVDLDGDGVLEILHMCKGNWVYCVNADGSERWRSHVKGHGIFYAPAVADFDGDGALEILVGVRDTEPETGACAYLLNAAGEVLDSLAVGGCGKSAPAVGDIDGDGELEAVLVTGRPSVVKVVSWGGSGAVAWPSIRGDSEMTARRGVPAGRPGDPVPRERAFNVRMESGSVFLGGNLLEAEWDRPVGPAGFSTVTVTPAEGYREVRVAPIEEGATSGGMSYWMEQRGPADLRLTIYADAGVAACDRVSVEPAPPEACGFEEVEKVWGEAIEAGGQAGADVRGLVARFSALESARDEVVLLAKMGAAPRMVAESATRLRKEAAAVQTLSRGLQAFWARGQGGHFVCWQDRNPWDRFDPTSMPKAIEANPALEVTMFGDEFEDVALNLLSIAPGPVDVRCSFVKPKPEGGAPDPEPELAKHITLRRAVRVPSQKHGMVNDLLPAMDDSGTMTLAPGAAAQLWLVVDSHGLEAGDHELTLYIGSLEEQPTYREVPLTIHVRPIRLLEGVYAQMNWGGIGGDYPSDQELQDMVDHGVSVVYGPALPPISLNSDGQLAGPVDWRATDAGLARIPGYFQLMFTRPPRMVWPEGMEVAEDSALYQKGHETVIHTMVEHLAEKGFGYDRWAFYPYDEPWLTGFSRVPMLRAFCESTKRVDPKIRNYANPAGLVRAEYLEEFKDLVDVWQPEMNLLKRDPELLRWFQENANTFWAYEATEPAKDLLPLGYYRANGWLSWMLGLDGSGFWVYRDHDLFWPVEIDHHGAVYRVADGVVPSRRWEASRDGVEDYRALYVLQSEIEKAAAAGREAEAEQARALMKEAIDRVIAWQALRIDEVTRQTREYELDLDLIETYRARIAQEIVRLRAL